MSATPAPWALVGVLYGIGLLAAAQLGKLSALAPLIAADLQLGLPTVAAAISLLELGGATLGAVAGVVAQRFGLQQALRWGLAALALGGLGSALAQGAVGLLAWRLLEALGYLGVIVSAPVLIAQHTGAVGARQQGLALALWSTFVPVGMALGAWGSAGLAGALGWRAALLGGGVLVALAWLVLWFRLWRAAPPAVAAVPVVPARPITAADPALGLLAGTSPAAAGATALPWRPAGAGAAAWCLALAFGAFALFEVGLVALLPTLLVRDAGLSAAAAGQWAALVSVAAVLGSAAAALLLKRGHGRALRAVLLLALGLPALLLFGVFSPAPQAGLAIALALLISVLGGLFASLAFALLPVVAGSAGQMVRANGLLAQCGASGSLLGPPLMAACVQAGGWPAAAVLGLVVTAAALPLAWRAAAALPKRHPAALAASGADAGHGQAGHPLD